VLGGTRSGKSHHAEVLLRRERQVTYLACGPVPDGTDPEWAQRVTLHRARRPPHWHTRETTELTAPLRQPGPALLIDCLTTWLAATMDGCSAWDPDPDADQRLHAHTDELITAWTDTSRRVVAVSNEVGSGIVPATPAGRRFRDELGALNARIAAASRQVWLVTAGIPRRLR
jgi:adenosylcobinamide kinase/adenosylcobinamide-phosphate guanylyltransferase